MCGSSFPREHGHRPKLRDDRDVGSGRGTQPWVVPFPEVRGVVSGEFSETIQYGSDEHDPTPGELVLVRLAVAPYRRLTASLACTRVPDCRQRVRGAVGRQDSTHVHRCWYRQIGSWKRRVSRRCDVWTSSIMPSMAVSCPWTAIRLASGERSAPHQVMVIRMSSVAAFPLGFSESVACTTTSYFPLVVGVPLIVALIALKAHPGGRSPVRFQ